VRRGPWKWVSGSLTKNEPALFNITEDPSEKKNLMAEHPEIAESLQKEFALWNRTLAAPQWTTLQTQPPKK